MPAGDRKSISGRIAKIIFGQNVLGLDIAE
jgi:hypothetical protein